MVGTPALLTLTETREEELDEALLEAAAPEEEEAPPTTPPPNTYNRAELAWAWGWGAGTTSGGLGPSSRAELPSPPGGMQQRMAEACSILEGALHKYKQQRSVCLAKARLVVCRSDARGLTRACWWATTWCLGCCC